MPKRFSAGIVLFRTKTPTGSLEVLLVHPGGPYFRRKDEGFWSIPKGEPEPDEAPEATACREFAEELGAPAPQPEALIDLGCVRQKGGKCVQGFAAEGDLPDGWELDGCTFEIEWPPRSGRMQSFPEVDRAEWFELEAAHRKINVAQRELLQRLNERLSSDGGP